MSDDVPAETVLDETVSETVERETGNRRGRPRPEETIARDQSVLDALSSPMTKAQLMDKTGYTGSETYLSLWRLRDAGLVERVRVNGVHTWQQTASDHATA